jgi:hypothetical protein
MPVDFTPKGKFYVASQVRNKTNAFGYDLKIVSDYSQPFETIEDAESWIKAYHEAYHDQMPIDDNNAFAAKPGNVVRAYFIVSKDAKHVLVKDYNDDILLYSLHKQMVATREYSTTVTFK